VIAVQIGPDRALGDRIGRSLLGLGGIEQPLAQLVRQPEDRLSSRF
jgi:hypothetical protein